jgi:peptide deformylase
MNEETALPMIKITEYPAVVETKCMPVEQPWSDLTPNIWSMNEYVKAYNGLGLAAPQIGDFRTYFIMRHNDLLTVCINPKYEVLQAPWMKGIEGCYSLPGKRYLVKRPTRVNAEWTDLLGQRQHCILTGRMAVIFHHEVLHLESKCICDVGKPVKS